ncbi:MAG: adenine deaminase [Mogibacterium sp.]|nr:adenine deaminase [Mogibacterium sp.]
MRYEQYKKLAPAALGKVKADLILRNCKIIDVFTGEIVESSVGVKDGIIIGVSKSLQGKEEVDLGGAYIAPGFIDAHLHLESTMVAPSELVATAAACGTTTFIVDPHEAANVAGADGINYILKQTEKSTANVFVMMPSCVPATDIDDNGCMFAANDMYPFIGNPRILGLGEVMDDFAVINGDPRMFAKFALFEHQTIDGHAPFLRNRQLSAYRMAGVETDHEASSFDYALEEARRGIHVHVREGSAAHNLDDIISGIVKSGIDTEHFSFCTDDKHIEDILREGHINYNVRRAVELGLDPFKAIKMATINTAKCYSLKNLGAIAPGYQADFVIFDNIKDFNVIDVYFKGKRIDRGAEVKVPKCPPRLKHTVNLEKVSAEDFVLPIRSRTTHVIGMSPRQIVTEDIAVKFKKTDNFVPGDGYLKIAAIERHKNSGKIGVAVAEGYGIKGGAIASSVSHDSHNIIAIGDSDESIAAAVNEIIRVQGGYTVVENGKVFDTLPLPIMGLMTDVHFREVDERLRRMKDKAYSMGVSKDFDPFITLSFMALTVIPELRVTPRGLYSVKGLSSGFIKQ